jgi:hypothetical protein
MSPIQRILMNFGICFFKHVENIQFSLKYDKNIGTLCVDQSISLIISRSLILRMRNVSDKHSSENQDTFCVP